MKYIGENIRKLRKEKGIRQGDLAEMMGITSTYLSLVETGKKDSSLKLVMDAAKVFNVDPGAIVSKNIASFLSLKKMLDGVSMEELIQAIDLVESLIGLHKKAKKPEGDQC